VKQFRLAAAVLAGLISSCAPQPPPPAPVARGAPAEFPEARYLQAAADGKPVFRIDPARSLVVVEVRRSGSLGTFGHDHVVASHDVTGFVAPAEGGSDLYVALERLTVDEPELRAQAGFDTRPTESDIAGTRRNMLERVLEAERYPFALIRVGTAGGNASMLDVAITLHGVTRTLRVPVTIETADGEFAVSGRVALNQTDFGITPFSILGGAIQVQDRVDLRFHIRARRMSGG
jgi:hypothetical protein